MIDPSALQSLLMVLTGWLERRERESLAYLIEENLLLRRQLRAAASSGPMTTDGRSPRARFD